MATNGNRVDANSLASSLCITTVHHKRLSLRTTNICCQVIKLQWRQGRSMWCTTKTLIISSNMPWCNVKASHWCLVPQYNMQHNSAHTILSHRYVLPPEICFTVIFLLMNWTATLTSNTYRDVIWVSNLCTSLLFGCLKTYININIKICLNFNSHMQWISQTKVSKVLK